MDPLSTAKLVVEIAKLGVDLFSTIRKAVEGGDADPAEIARSRAQSMAAGHAAWKASKQAGKKK